MEFNHFLSSYLPHRAYGGKRRLDDMMEQARLAEEVMPHFVRRLPSGLSQVPGVA